MTDEQLEELQRGVSPHDIGLDVDDVLQSLARRALAAERLVEELGTVRDYVSDAKDGALFYDNGDRVSYTMASDDLECIDAALTAYREASK